MRKLRPRGINEVTRKWKRCFLVSVQSILRKLCGKVHCRSRSLGKNLDFNSFFPPKKQTNKIKCVTSTAKQCPRCLEGPLHLIENKIYEEIVINIPIYTSGSWDINEIASKWENGFAKHIYLYLVNFVGKGIVYLECFRKKLDFNSIKKKMKYVT